MINFISLISKISIYSFEIIFGVFCVLTIGLIYVVLDNGFLKPYLGKNYLKKFNIANFETRLFFLFLSVIILFSELIQVNFQKVVPLQFISIITAILSLIVAVKYSFLSKNKNLIEYLLIGFFLVYQINILFKMYFVGSNLVYFGTIIILFFSASIVLKSYVSYFVNVIVVFTYFFILLKLNKIESYDFYVLITSILAVILVTYGNRLSLLFTLKNLEFSKELINNSSSLLCAFDKFGNLLYVNNAITTILGYTSSEVRGKKFWLLTQDPDFVDIDYNELFQAERAYIRKLTSKSGKLNYILWSEKKMNDNLFVSSGQDVTANYLQNQNYQSLFDNVSEIIYELDSSGKFTRINNYAEKVCGYNKDELSNVFFKDLVYPDDISKINEHYKNVSRTIINYKPLEFRVLKKDGGYIWVSQIVNTKLNSHGQIFGFTAVARVITEEKEIQLKQDLNIIQNIKYQNLINELYTSNLDSANLSDIIKYIIELSNSILEIDRVSIWKYNKNGIALEYLHLFNNCKNNILEENQVLRKVDYPNYFASMEKLNSLIVNDVELNIATKELYDDYFHPNNIKSLLDHVIKINGKVDRIICFEEVHFRNWTEDEIRFTRTIANYLALVIERNEKSKIEYLLNKRGKLLNSINKINTQLISCTNFIDILNCDYDKIGKISNASRLFFYENRKGSSFFNLKYKWLGDSVQDKTGIHSFSIFDIENYSEIQTQFKQQGYFSANKNSLLSTSLEQLFNEINIKTLLLLPLYINGNLFGIIGLDDSEKSRNWQDEDIEIFKSFAKNLEAAIGKVTFLNKIKESEQKFELLANNIPAGIYLLKYKTRRSSKIYFNNQMEQITGYSISDFYENKISLVDLYHPDDKEMAKRAIYHALKERGTYRIKVRIVHKTGKIVNIEEYGGTIVVNDKIAYIEGVVIAAIDK